MRSRDATLLGFKVVEVDRMGLRGRGWKLGEHADVSGDGPTLPQAGTYCYISQLQLTLLQGLPSGARKHQILIAGIKINLIRDILSLIRIS